MYLQESDNLWWDAFATEFFEDDASLTLTFCLEDGPKRYSELHAKKKRKERKKVCTFIDRCMYNLNSETLDQTAA